MDDVVSASVEFDILANLSFLGGKGFFKFVFFPRLIRAAGEPDLEVCDALHDRGEESVKDHGVD